MTETPGASQHSLLSRDAALGLARGAASGLLSGLSAVVLETDVVERPFVFLFPVTSARYRETHDPRDGVLGCTHILVDRRDGRVESMDIHRSIGEALDRYEARRELRLRS